MRESVILTKYAEDLIKKGQYKKAKVALIKSVKFDKLSDINFALLGDVYYLLEDRDNAIKAYLAYTHLQINKFTRVHSATLSTLLNVRYNRLEPEVRELLPCKEGMIVYEDNSISSNIAHAYVDLDIGEKPDPIVKECSKIHKNHIITRKPIKDLMHKSNLCFEDYNSFNNSHYILIGRELLLSNIDWTRITSNEVIKIYFKKRASE